MKPVVLFTIILGLAGCEYWQGIQKRDIEWDAVTVPATKAYSVYQHSPIVGELIFTVTEVTGKNIEFEIIADGRAVYESGVYSGSHTASYIFPVPLKWELKLTNANLIHDKVVNISVKSPEREEEEKGWLGTLIDKTWWIVVMGVCLLMCFGPTVMANTKSGRKLAKELDLELDKDGDDIMPPVGGWWPIVILIALFLWKCT